MKTKVEIIPTQFEHCLLLSEALDAKAREIIKKGWDVDPFQGLVNAWGTSRFCMSIFINGKIAGIFGCSENADCSVGYPWLTTASLIEQYKIRFVRQSKKYLDYFKSEYPVLICHAYKENRLLLNWLIYSGFEISGMKGEFYECVYRH